MIPLSTTNSAPAGTATDPVCGMTVDPVRAAGSHAHDGQTYHFCSTHCLHKFRADPARYLAGHRESMTEVAATAEPTPGVRYVCPMDPEVVSDRPGPCPKCGMALEPETATPDAGPDPRRPDPRRPGAGADRLRPPGRRAERTRRRRPGPRRRGRRGGRGRR